VTYDISWDRCTTQPREHQRDGVKWLLRTPLALLADEVGAGKSKQVVDTAQILFEAGEIDAVVVLCPAFARGVWSNPDPLMGEVAKHSWGSVPYASREYSVLNNDLTRPIGLTSNRTKEELIQHPFLRWVVANYEFIRRTERLTPLINYLITRRFWLVLDEAWAIKDQHTDTWKSVYQVRRLTRRVTLLNGTPIADSPMDMNAQMRMLDDHILGFQYLDAKGREKWSCADTRFRSHYALMKPNVNFPLITGWQNLEELRAKVSPYVMRRKTRDCFDLPPILEPITLEARLKAETWRIYCQMRDDMLAWLGTDDGQDVVSIASQAIVKGLRLAQITSGFLGGVQKLDLGEGFLDFGTDMARDQRMVDQPVTMLKEIGREKLDTLFDWLPNIEQPNRILIWSRFRAEIERTCREFNEAKPPIGRKTYMLYGGQTKDDRERAVRALHPDYQPDEPLGVVGHPAAGGAGLNLAGASMAISLSEDFSLRVFLQKNGRIDRPGQHQAIRYVNIVATGPKGQKTFDHHVVAALRGKEDIANWTAATWRKKLMEE
jgi:SNF2 family DNA or RNA helicase